MDKDIDAKSQACEACASKCDGNGKVSLHPWEVPKRCWYRNHTDFAKYQNTMHLVVVDAYRKWPEVSLMPSPKTESNIKAFRDIVRRQGPPNQVVSDNGPKYTSATVKNFLQQQGIQHILPPLYHRQSNGLVKNFVRTLKAASRKSKDGEEK